LERLVEQGVDTVLLLRPTSGTRRIMRYLGRVQVRQGSVTEPGTLGSALVGITHVIHCAGCTKTNRLAEFHETNQIGVANLLRAMQPLEGQIQRFVHLSSLAACGPREIDNPAREEDPPAPVSIYGESKLAGEREIVSHCRVPYVILRPPAIYGPGDRDFLSLFRAVQSRVVPLIRGGRQALSLVYVKDLAEVTVAALSWPEVGGGVFHVAHEEVLTSGQLVKLMARLMGVAWYVPLSIPASALWLACATQDALSALRGQPHVLSRWKWRELTARGWVCDVTRLRRQFGGGCATSAEEGLGAALAWYRREGWLA
jgi:nucleoside-diphosphate-sugar epimerase